MQADEDGDDASAEARGAVSGTQAADGNIPGAGGPGEYERLARAAADSVFVPSQALDANAGRVACVQQERLAREAVEDVRRCRAAHEEASARAHACSEIVNHMKAEVAELNELVAAAGNGTPGGRNGVPELSQLLTCARRTLASSMPHHQPCRPRCTPPPCTLGGAVWRRWQADRQRALDAETAIAAMATGEVWKRNAELDAAERHAQKLTALRDDVAAQRAADLQTQRALAERLVAKCAITCAAQILCGWAAFCESPSALDGRAQAEQSGICVGKSRTRRGARSASMPSRSEVSAPHRTLVRKKGGRLLRPRRATCRPCGGSARLALQCKRQSAPWTPEAQTQ